MSVPKASRSAVAKPLSTEQLRRAALARSARRGGSVASRRVALRWTLWYGSQALKWGSVPAVLVAGVVAWWNGGSHPAPSPARAPAPAAARPSERVPVADPASVPAIEPSASQPVYLRLDAAEAVTAPPAPRQAQSPSSAANDGRAKRE